MVFIEIYIFNKIVFGYEGNYNVLYSFNVFFDMLEFLVEVRVIGWVGFGVVEIVLNNMIDYDVVIGGVLRNGIGYLKVSWLLNINEYIFVKNICEYMKDYI